MISLESATAKSSFHRTIDTRWLLGSFALGLLLAASVSLARQTPSLPVKHETGRVVASLPFHGVVRSGKVMAVSPRFSPIEIQGRPIAPAPSAARGSAREPSKAGEAR
jgi:hypothetical protein